MASWMLKHSKQFTVSKCGMNGLATAPSARRHTPHETSRHVCAQRCLAAAGRPPVATCGAMLQRVVLCCNMVRHFGDRTTLYRHTPGTFEARSRLYATLALAHRTCSLYICMNAACTEYTFATSTPISKNRAMLHSHSLDRRAVLYRSVRQ